MYLTNLFWDDEYMRNPLGEQRGPVQADPEYPRAKHSEEPRYHRPGPTIDYKMAKAWLQGDVKSIRKPEKRTWIRPHPFQGEIEKIPLFSMPLHQIDVEIIPWDEKFDHGQKKNSQ